MGINGCGKSTLIRILTGLERPDSGLVSLTAPNVRLGYLPQGFDLFASLTVGDYLETVGGGYARLLERVEQLAARLAETPLDETVQADYAEVLEAMLLAGESQSRMEEILPALGLDKIPRQQAAVTLSGGQKTRLALVGVLMTAPQVLLLDEPTNHLDIDMLNWLEDWLLKQSGAMLLVSHDRYFLERVTNGILDLDNQTHRIKFYEGNFSAYLAQKEAEVQRQWEQYEDQRVELKRLKRAADRMRSRARAGKTGKTNRDNDKFMRGFFSDRSLETMRRAKTIEKRVEQLQSEDKIEKPRENWKLKMGFESTVASGRDVLVLQDLCVGYGERRLIGSLTATIRYGERAVLMGCNGSGKTSLFKTILGEISPLAGEVRLGSRVQVGYMAQEEQQRFFKKDALNTLLHLSHYSETEARRFLSYYLFFGDDVFTPVESLSYGERARLSLACLVAQGCNFLMLDEPGNHLDIPSQMRFEAALATFEGTIFTISHDRYFIERFASEIWEINDGRVVRTPLETGL
ncbi:MAG: ATP-binding cassette domain-containing protein [Anaerolineae bacterium]|nr:ATP-binding cassette domain-containing protein [Anaerolineae bacterium]